jgi:hypothetical protein
MRSLATQWGVPNVPDQHWSASSAWEFVDALAEAEKRKLREALAKAEGGKVGVIVDDSTAVDNVQYLAIGIVWVQDGVRNDAFLALRHVEKATGANIAEKIAEELQDIMPEGWDLRRNFVAVGCDGASVMLGAVRGVNGILKTQYAPYSAAMHCSAHRVSLACKDFDDNEAYAAVDSCLRESQRMFARSPSAHAAFKELQKLFSEDENRLLRIHDIRWLSIYSVLDRWHKEYKTLLVYTATKRGTDLSAGQLYNQMRDAKVLVTSIAMKPLLESLHVLVKEIQSPDFSFEHLAQRLEGLQEMIDADFNEDNLTKFGGIEFKDFIEIGGEKSPLFWDDGDLKYKAGATDHFVLWKGEHVMEDLWNGEIFTFVVEQVGGLASSVSAQLKERFPKKELLEAMSILQASYWLSEESMRPDFEESVKLLAEFYGEPKTLMSDFMAGVPLIPPINAALLRKQAGRFEREMARLGNSFKQGDSQNDPKLKKMGITKPLWTYVMKSPLRGDISEFVTLAIIMLIMPASSAQAERLFSSMNFIKNDHRNRLGEEHLNHTIRLFTSKYDMDDFPFETALEIFLSRKDRRGVCLTGGQRKKAGVTGALDPVLFAQAILDNE